MSLDAERLKLFILNMLMDARLAVTTYVGRPTHQVGARHGRLIPVSMLLGALLVSVADILGRTLISPAQIPAGLMIALIGGPYFVWLLRRSRG